MQISKTSGQAHLFSCKNQYCDKAHFGERDYTAFFLISGSIYSINTYWTAYWICTLIQELTLILTKKIVYSNKLFHNQATKLWCGFLFQADNRVVSSRKRASPDFMSRHRNIATWGELEGGRWISGLQDESTVRTEAYKNTKTLMKKKELAKSICFLSPDSLSGSGSSKLQIPCDYRQPQRPPQTNVTGMEEWTQQTADWWVTWFWTNSRRRNFDGKHLREKPTELGT